MTDKKIFNEIMDGLDSMLVALVRSTVWNYSLVRSFMSTTRIVCARLNDYELYHIAVNDLVKKWLFKLPENRKWEALSLMRDELGSGNTTNELGEYFSKHVSRPQFQNMIQKCPDLKTKQDLRSFLIYYKNK